MWEQAPNLRHLAAFLEVLQRHNISQAAEHIHLSQPAITQAIAKLERDLGVELFERGPGGMHPTELGTLYGARVKCALDYLRMGASEALRIGAKKKSGGFSNFDRLLTVAQLRALAAVSRTGNFSLAAREMGISQPSIHRAARDLERLCGLTLFEKTRKGIELTEPAQTLVQYARLAFAELRHGTAEIGEWSGLDPGCIALGCLPLSRTHVLPIALNALCREKPNVRVQVFTGPYDDLLYQLRHGEIDIIVGALRNPPPIGDIVQEAYFHAPLAILARAEHPLARKNIVTFEDLKECAWILPPEGTPARAYYEKTFGAIPGAHRGVIETSSMVLVRGLLTESDRLTIMSAHQMRHEIERGEVVVLPLDLPDSARPLGVTVRTGWRPTATQKLFLDHLRTAASTGSF